MTNEQGFAISCDGLWAAGTVNAGGKWRLVLGVKEKRVIYPTRAAAQTEMDHLALDEEGYEIEEVV